MKGASRPHSPCADAGGARSGYRRTRVCGFVESPRRGTKEPCVVLRKPLKDGEQVRVRTVYAASSR